MALYAYSRNPQYVADMAIILGMGRALGVEFGLCSSARSAFFILGLAPFAEEPWLEENYGQQYRDYKTSVRRYF